jgi:hypothetical protein
MDITNDMSAKTFKKLQDFMSNQFFTNFNHFERLGFGIFESSFLSWDPPGYIDDLREIQNRINGFQQEGSSPSIEL